jgi:hypothetical protein
MKNKMILGVMLIILSISGCLDDGNKDSGDEAKKTELKGTWSLTDNGLTCISNDSTQIVKSYYKTNMIFSGNDIKLIKYFYKTESCGNTYKTEKTIGVFKIGDSATSSEGLSFKTIDFIFEKEGSTIKSYTIYRIDGSKLYLGKQTNAKNGNTPESRPQALNQNNYYQKQ